MSDTRARTSVWKGLNRMPFIADGEMRDMKNLCSDAFPYITTRKGRAPYTFDILVPSPEGEAYRDTERLPAPCKDERDNIYKVTGEVSEDVYTSGSFYSYDTDTETWVEEMPENFLGVVKEEKTSYNSSHTLYSTAYYTHTFEGYRYPYNERVYRSTYVGKLVKYLGENTESFKFGKTYRYGLYVEAYWVQDTRRQGTNLGSFDAAPEAAEDIAIALDYFKYTGTTNSEFTNGLYYKCLLRGYGFWEEADAVYEPVRQMPEDTSKYVRYMGEYYGAPVESTYYICDVETDADGEVIYFYTKADTGTEAEEVTFLPEAGSENYAKTFFYSGIEKDEFAECIYENGEYVWEEREHPQVMRTVEFEEYLRDYKEILLESIIEIAAFSGKPAVLFRTEDGVIKLYYDENIWDVNNVTEEPGKKLSVAGSKLIVGESGSYLHINSDGETEYFSMGGSFAVTITARYAEYGNGGENAKWSSISGSVEKNTATFKILAPGNNGYGFETVYNGLSIEGTGFSATFKGKTYYLKSKSVTYEKNVNIAGWKVGDNWYYDYADRLTIIATGVMEDFEWNNIGTGFSLNVTFASTDPHYYDVVAWKKRLWGYRNNVLYGTASDIFDDNGLVDWNRGDNTYLEAISQPIWQGGKITGLAALSSALILFKEDSLTVFTGNYPAVMSGSTITCRGLSEENRDSVAVGNESVFYLSEDGVYRFTGGIPQCISRNEKIQGTDAVGISDGNKYWLSLKEKDGYALYVYDVEGGLWHKEDDLCVKSFTMLGSNVYAADEKQIYNIGAEQEAVDWELVLWFDEGTYKKKKYKELSLRGDVGKCELQLKCDDGEWRAAAWSEETMQVKLPPQLCEELQIRLKGNGICCIKSLDRIFEVIE